MRPDAQDYGVFPHRLVEVNRAAHRGQRYRGRAGDLWNQGLTPGPPANVCRDTLPLSALGPLDGRGKENLRCLAKVSAHHHGRPHDGSSSSSSRNGPSASSAGPTDCHPRSPTTASTGTDLAPPLPARHQPARHPHPRLRQPQRHLRQRRRRSASRKGRRPEEADRDCLPRARSQGRRRSPARRHRLPRGACSSPPSVLDCSAEIPEERKAPGRSRTAPTDAAAAAGDLGRPARSAISCRRRALRPLRRGTSRPRWTPAGRGEFVLHRLQGRSPSGSSSGLLELARWGRPGPRWPSRATRSSRELGRGGMGAVYLARHEKTGRARGAQGHAAPGGPVTTAARRLFLREIEDTASCSHPQRRPDARRRLLARHLLLHARILRWRQRGSAHG